VHRIIEANMNNSKIVILGGGMVAGYAAKQLVELGLPKGELAILSADDAVPYERPPLSKGFLAGKDSENSIKISPDDFYQKQGIELRLECEIASVDVKRKRLIFKGGDEFGFQKLVIATGARPRTLKIPGSNLQNLFYLRTLSNSKTIRNAAEKAKHAVVIGGGFIGMEVAAVLAQKGIEVTMVLNDDRVFKRLCSPEMSRFFETYYAARGVRLIKSMSVTELRGDGAVKSAVLKNGQSVPCDLVAAGIGVQPSIEMLTNSGLDVGDGIVVNEYLRATDADILAAGDVANYPDVIFGKRRRVEHWDNAVSQGQYCARSLMGDKMPFRHVPYFFSDVFDLSYEYWGDSSSADHLVHRGDLSSNSFSVWWMRQQRLVAAFTMNRSDEERNAAPQWIESGQSVSPAKLADESQPIAAAAASAA
jgi:NADPH-dependent 2,4-dienoyl-CoA reductase/sulfur reductase-like enzyme